MCVHLWLVGALIVFVVVRHLVVALVVTPMSVGRNLTNETGQIILSMPLRNEDLFAGESLTTVVRTLANPGAELGILLGLAPPCTYIAPVCSDYFSKRNDRLGSPSDRSIYRSRAVYAFYCTYKNDSAYRNNIGPDSLLYPARMGYGIIDFPIVACDAFNRLLLRFRRDAIYACGGYRRPGHDWNRYGDRDLVNAVGLPRNCNNGADRCRRSCAFAEKEARSIWMIRMPWIRFISTDMTVLAGVKWIKRPSGCGSSKLIKGLPGVMKECFSHKFPPNSPL